MTTNEGRSGRREPAVLRRYLPWFFLYAMACPMAFPITPTIIANLGIPDFMFGVSYATMNFFSFLLAPLWGRLSDRYGRARLLTVALLGASAGQTVLCFAQSAWTLVLARSITGCFSAGHVINSMAYFADLSTEETRRRNLALHATLSAVFSAMGYLLGGVLGNVSPRFTFVVQIGLLWLCAATLFPVIGDAPRQSDSADNHKPALPAKARLTLVLALSLALTVTATAGLNLFDEAFNYFLTKNLGFQPSRLGLIRAAIGLIGLCTYLGIHRRLLRRDFIRPAQVGAYAGCTAALFLAVFAKGTAGFIGFAILFHFFHSITAMLLQVSVVGESSPQSTGTTAGVYQSCKTLGSVLGALASGFAYQYRNNLPFVVAALVFCLSLLLSLSALLASRARSKPTP